MKKHDAIWTSAWEEIQGSLQALFEDVFRTVSGVVWSCGHYANSSQPLVAYASFYRPKGVRIGADDEGVDVVITFQQFDESLTILADVSLQQGAVLAEMPEVQVAVPSFMEDMSTARDTLAVIKGFILRQSGVVAHTLRLL